MSNVCFAFGPENSYLCNSPSKWTRYKLPAAVENLFTKQPPIKDIYELAIGPSGSYYVGYLDHNNTPYCMNYGLPVHLTKWLSKNAQGFVGHDIRTTTVTLGPKGSYVVKDKKNMQWCGIPDALAARLNSFGTARTKMVTLGIDDTYVVVNTDGSGLRSLGSRFPDLEKKLASFPSLINVHYVSLSTFPAISASGGVDDAPYMLVMKNGSADGVCPDGHEASFNAVISELPKMQPAVAQAPGRSRRQVSSSSASSFLKVLSGVAKVANALNGGGGGGGGGVSYGGSDSGGGFDTSGFAAGLQQQTWSSTSGAAGDPIQ